MPRKHTLACSDCQKPMWAGNGSLPQGQARCQPCRSANRPSSCRLCGVPVSKNASTGRCSPCANGVSQRKGRTCEICSTEYEATYLAQRTCGRACGAVLNVANKRDKASTNPAPFKAPASRIYIRYCGVCAGPFVGRAGRGKRPGVCSAQCRIDRAGLRVKDLYGMVLKHGISVEGLRWYDCLIDWLRERDGDDCHLCDMPIDFTVKSGPKGNDSGRSVDHLTPRSKGGSDDPSNLRLAHWGCNRERRTRPLSIKTVEFSQRGSVDLAPSHASLPESYIPRFRR